MTNIGLLYPKVPNNIGGIFPMTSVQPKYWWGCVPGIPGGVDASEQSVPREFKDASIVHLYKRKGYRANCDNHRGILLLATAGKILSKIKQYYSYSRRT